MTGEALAGHTTFGVGGRCAAWAEAVDAAGVAEAAAAMRRAGLEVRALGGGSNVLAADGGVPFGVVHVGVPGGGDGGIRRTEGGGIEVAAGVALDEVARWSVEEGGGEFAWASGIPGTVGGAVAGNAGAFGMQTGDWTEEVEVVFPDGSVRWVRGEEMGFAYRWSRLAGGGNGIAARVRFRAGSGGDRGAARARRDEILAMRREKHPSIGAGRDGTAGSFFKNLPPLEEGGRRRAIGAELEAIGAKGERCGGAYVWGKHANILMAGPGATAADVDGLARRLESRLLAEKGIRAEREVQCWGFSP